MATTTKLWGSGSGSVTITYGGSGNGNVSVVSDANTIYEQRSMDITIQTTAGSPQQTKTVSIVQAAKLRIDISTAVVTCANQTYSGSALTPTPTVTLNGTTIPSTGYDVTYSNNTNAGTATITVTGKGDYTGSASGSFTIAQATGQVTTAPTARSVTYSGSAQYLVVAGSGTGTMQYRYKLDSASSWSSWSTTRARATNAGTYNVQYRAAASSDGNYTVSAVGELNVTMAKATRTISFTTKPTSVDVNDTVNVVATPSISDGTVTYTSSDTSIATVSGNVVTGVAEGSVIITASVPETNNCYSATVSYTIGVVFNYAKEYLTIESLEGSNTITWQASSGAERLSIDWSTDKETWTAVTSTVSGATITTLSKGQKLYLRGSNETYGVGSGTEGNTFTSTAECIVSGNILSLIYGNSFVGKLLPTYSTYTFKSMFKAMIRLISAQDLILPSSNIKQGCFSHMFYQCSGLRVAPKLPATSLATYCYRYMFYGCTSLVKAPKLPATTLLSYCYNYMFYGCSKLNYVWCPATSISATNCTTNWLTNVQSTGEFISGSASTSWSSGGSGIPSGWTRSYGRSGYTKVEYLQSSGTQYIDLDFYGTAVMGAEIKFKYHDLSSSSASARIFGTREGSGSKAFAYVTSYSGTTDTTKAFYLACRNSATASTFAVKIDSEDHVVKINVNNDGKAYIDSTLALTAGDIGSFTSTGIASLFRTYSASNGGYLGACVARIYYLKIYYMGKLIMDLVPVRASDSTTTGWMYDQISDVFYENCGTGNFVVGPDV